MTHLVEEADAAPEVRAIYAEIRAARGGPANMWKALANHPPTLTRVWRLVQEVLGPGALDQRTKELIFIAVATTLRSEYAIAAHKTAARAMGLTDAEVAEAVAVAALAAHNAQLLAAYAPPIDARFQDRRFQDGHFQES